MDKSSEAQVREICDWLYRQVYQADARGVVLAVDGGINSTVAAALAHRALGTNALALLFPMKDPDPDVECARGILDHLGMRWQVIDLSQILGSAATLFCTHGPLETGSFEARLRMMASYHLASSLDYLVLGTACRSDWELGRFVRYGDDGAGDLLPLIHLLKKEIWAIGRFLKLPDHQIHSSASADLWEKHSESGCALTYAELDAYLLGDLLQVPAAAQQRIRTLQQAAVRKKRPPARFSFGNTLPEKELSFWDDYEVYDKSIEALSLISRAITSEQYLEDILRLIVMVTAEVMSSSVCSLWLLDEKERVLRLRATQSIDREYLKDRVLRVGEGVVGKVVAEDRPYAVANVLLDPIFKEKELARRMGLVSMLSMPMRVKDRVIGVINCYTSHPHAFSDLQMNVLTAVANQAAVAIEKTELIVQTKVIQEELERRKIIERAKDLLMKRFELSGEESYRWLQKRSMNTRKSMREVSEAVLLTMEG